MSDAKFEMEKFTGKNDFGLWKVKMKAVLIQQGLWEALRTEEDQKEGEENQKDEKEVLKKQEQRERAHSAIILSLGDRVLREVCKEKTAVALWAKLDSIYMTKSLANRLYMKQKLYSFKIVEGKGISEQLEDFAKALDDLENIDVEIKDEDKAIILLNALPKSFEQLKDAMLYGRENTITYDEVQVALKTKEINKVSVKPLDPASESLNIRANDKKFSKKKGKGKFKSGKEKDEPAKETRSCHYCKKTGHLKKNCYSWKRKKEEKAATQNNADIAQEIQSAEVLNVIENDISNCWIMDSGCSFHMCPKLEWFQSVEKSLGTVLLGNNQICLVKGIGSIRLKLQNGSEKLLTEVRYIPDIKRNLISLGVLEQKGCSFLSSGGVMKIMRGSEVVMEARRKHSLYYLAAEAICNDLHLVKKADAEIWHLRLGHVSIDGVNQLINKGLIEADSKLKSRDCEVCVLGKSKKLSYPTGKHTSSNVLDYAHSEVISGASTDHYTWGRKVFPLHY